MRKAIMIAVGSMFAATLYMLGMGHALADRAPDGESCTYIDASGQWIDDGTDGGLCRGTGEDITTDSKGRPVCVSGLPGHYSDGRFMCSVSATLGSVQLVSDSKPKNPNPCEDTPYGHLRKSKSGTYYSCKPKNA